MRTHDLMNSSSGKKQDNTTSGKLSGLLKPIVDEFVKLDGEKQFVILLEKTMN